MRRYLRVLRVFLGATLSAALEYRFNFLTSLLTSVSQAGVAYLGLYLFFSRPEITTLGGWSFNAALAVVGFFLLTEGFVAVVLQPNLTKIAESVRTGSMDFTLLKPIDAQWSVSTRNLNLLRLTDVAVGLGVLVWVAPRLDATPGGVLLAALLYTCSLAIMYSLWFMLSTTAFWFIKTDNVTELANGVFSAGRFPVASFPPAARAVLTFVLPVAFVTTVPAQALSGTLSPALGLAAPLVALFFLLVSRLFWQRAVAGYTSASS